MLAVYEDEARSYSAVATWAAEWNSSGRNIQDPLRFGRLVDVTTIPNTMRVMELVENDHRITVEQISRKMSIGYGTVQRILDRELALSKLSACWVSKMLSSFDKMTKFEISSSHLD